MPRRQRSHGTPLDSGNHPGNSLRSYRMSMLAHGFVDESDHKAFKPDDVDPLSYGVVRFRGGRIPVVAAIAVAVLVAIALSAAVFG